MRIQMIRVQSNHCLLQIKEQKEWKKWEWEDDPTTIYESSRRKNITISKSKIHRSYKHIFSKKDSQSDEEIINSSIKIEEEKNAQSKYNEELLDRMIIHEILSESEWSENEDIKASIITSLTDKFNITEEEPDGNCLFRALSRGCFGSPEFHGEIRESIWDYILHNNQRFANHLHQEAKEYVQKMLEDGEWGGEPEIVAFSELYNVNVTVYDAMTSSIPYFTAENVKANHTVHLLMVINNHFNTLNVKNKSKFSHFQKVKKRL